MMKRLSAAALFLAAALLCACGNQGEPAPTPDPLAKLREEVGAIANTEITEEEGTLNVVILLQETGAETACKEFFEQAGQIYAKCLSGGEYTGISFSLMVNGADAGGFAVLPGEGGMKAMEPVSLSDEYGDALTEAFYESAFAKSFQE